MVKRWVVERCVVEKCCVVGGGEMCGGKRLCGGWWRCVWWIEVVWWVVERCVVEREVVWWVVERVEMFTGGGAGIILALAFNTFLRQQIVFTFLFHLNISHNFVTISSFTPS